jgi:hypothetical protein
VPLVTISPPLRKYIVWLVTLVATLIELVRITAKSALLVALKPLLAQWFVMLVLLDLRTLPTVS